MKSIQALRKTSGRRLRVVLPLTIILGLTVILAVQARNSGPYSFRLVPASDTIAGCLAGATATVTGDGQAGAAVLSSRNFVQSTPIP
jgi:hypothetical protein